MGVISMKFAPDDYVVGMQLNTNGDQLLVVSSKGMGKRTDISEFPTQRRGGKGIKCYKFNDKTGIVVCAKAVKSDQEIMLITAEGVIIRLKVEDIPVVGRVTSGVKLMNLEEGITIASVAEMYQEDLLLISGENTQSSTECEE
jgi:DNA gyrase subunit A